MNADMWAMLLAEYEKAIDEYHRRFPPESISVDGKYRMGEDGKWQARCIIVPFEQDKVCEHSED